MVYIQIMCDLKASCKLRYKPLIQEKDFCLSIKIVLLNQLA